MFIAPTSLLSATNKKSNPTKPPKNKRKTTMFHPKERESKVHTSLSKETNLQVTNMMKLFLFVATSIPAALAFSTLSPPAQRSAERLSTPQVFSLDDSSFDPLLLGHDKLALVDAYSQKCGPCILMEPILERCADQWKDSVVVTKYDVESKNIKCKFEFALQNVKPRKLPSLILFYKGQVVDKFEGMLLDKELNEFLRTNMPDALSERGSPLP